MKRKSIVSLVAISFLFVGLISFSPELKNRSVEKVGEPIPLTDVEEGPIFYPASYNETLQDETYYETQNDLTFRYCNFQNTSNTYKGDAVKVAIIDSGLVYTHEDFIKNGNQIIQGASRTIDNLSGSWVAYQFDVGYQTRINDTFGHGSNVASVIASQINEIGCAGIAPNVELYIYKVTNTKNGYEWTAINEALQYCIDNGIDVVNMSFQAYEHAVSYGSESMGASTGCSSVMTSKLNSCHNAGITLVAAAGNYNTTERSYPASNNYVISVGSLAKKSLDEKAGFSNLSDIDLVAPGYVEVATIGSNSSYKETSGTSFSAPIVTAAIALYKQQNPDATPAQIESALYASCDSITGNPSWAGNGRLNIDKFLNLESGAREIVINNPEVQNDSLTLQVGDTLDLDITVNGVGEFDDSVSFDNADNDVITVDSNGRITAVGVGEDTICVTSNDNPLVEQYIDVTVETPKTLTLSPANLSLYVGETGQLTASTSPSTTITYSSSNTTVATVSSSGLVTAKKAGSATITASANGLSKTCSVTVSNRPVESVTVSPKSASANVGSYVNLTATVSPSNATDKTVTWTSSDTSVATVNSSGRVTGVKQGTAVITATTQDGGFTDSCTITVNNIPVTSITLDKSSLSLYVGNVTALTATINPSSATIKTITWSSSNNAVATVSNGQIIAVSTGTAVITASADGGTNVTAQCSVTVSDAPTLVKVTTGVTLVTGDKVVLVTDENAPRGVTGWNNNKDATISATENDWKQYYVTVSGNNFTLKDETANKFIADPNSNNEFKYSTTGGSCSIVSEGYVRCGTRYLCINGSNYRFYGSVGSYVPFYLYKISKKISSISIKTAPTKTTYEVGETFDPTGLVITKTYTDNTTEDASYASQSSNFSFLPTTSAELTLEDTSVTIYYGGKSVTQSITVTPVKTLSSISISGQTTSLVEGDTFNFGGIVTAHFSDASTLDVTSSATFTGYNMTTVGSYEVTVSYLYKGATESATYNLTVTQGTLSSIAVSGQTTTYQKNYAFSFDGVCTATFENGYQKTVTPTSVSRPDMTTAGEKTVTVSFTYNGKTESTSYTIEVNSNRSVIEEGENVLGTITYTSDTEVISINTLSTTPSGAYSAIDTTYHAWRLGAGSKTGTLTVNSTTSNITKIVVNARYYGTDSGTTFKIGGDTKTLTNSYADYTKTYSTATNSVAITSVTNGKRVLIASITVYAYTSQDISQSQDCKGLETFIDTYMHMDYIQNFGYCSDSEHHYYSTAKSAFNELNPHQRSLFTSNSAYQSEWDRLSTWASKNGDSLNSNNILASRGDLNIFAINKNTNKIGIVAIISVISVSSIGAYFVLKRRKEN